MSKCPSEGLKSPLVCSQRDIYLHRSAVRFSFDKSPFGLLTKWNGLTCRINEGEGTDVGVTVEVTFEVQIGVGT